MSGNPAAAGLGAAPGPAKSARRRRRRIVLYVAGAGLLVGGAVCVLVGGLAGANIRELRDLAEFRQVLRSDQPVVVDFYKGGCPTCMAMDPVLNRLADEYRGRVIFARFELMKPYFAVTSEELKTQYDIVWFPTVILFVGGQPKKRWVLDYSAGAYRKALDKALAGPVAGKNPVGTGETPDEQ